MPNLEEMPLEFVRCRTFGHAWDEFVPVGMRKPSFGFRISLVCTSCGKERHDVIDQLGQVAYRDYVDPDGYYLGYRVKRDEVRLVYEQKRSRRSLERRETGYDRER